MGRLNWTALVREIGSHRAGAARFYKPICVIAAVDLADEGRIIHDDIDAHAILERFSDYITPFYPKRGKNGFKPLWHLTNDGLWTFFNGEEIVTAKAFAHGEPLTKAKLLSSFDRMAIHYNLAELWKSPQERRKLRESMLLMLSESDIDSQNLVAPLFDVKNLLNRDLWPSASVLNAYLNALRDQFVLFDDDSPEEQGGLNLFPKDIPTTPDAMENVPSPIGYTWSNGRSTVSSNSADAPVFPYVLSELSHSQRLEACTIQAQDLIDDISRRRFQIRDDYEIAIRRYLNRLPAGVRSGNILLADAAARALRDMFAAECDSLPPPFAAGLKTMLQQHIALRPFYPEIEDFYRAVKTGHIDAPLPLDAVSDVINVVRTQTPKVFDESVSEAIGEASSPAPKVTVVDRGVTDHSSISPPPDPLGELDPTKAHDFQTAGWVNGLWKVFKAGATVHANTEAWIASYRSLSDPIKQILTWLNQFIDR